MTRKQYKYSKNNVVLARQLAIYNAPIIFSGRSYTRKETTRNCIGLCESERSGDLIFMLKPPVECVSRRHEMYVSCFLNVV